MRVDGAASLERQVASHAMSASVAAGTPDLNVRSGAQPYASMADKLVT
jgi:hypothetical protein